MDRHVRLASLFVITSALFSGTARAQEAAVAPPPPPTPPAAPAPSVAVASPAASAPAESAREELAEFLAFAERTDEPARTYRLVGGLAALGVGGLVIPVGAAMYSREAGVGAGVTLGVGIGTALGGAFVLMGSMPRPYRDAADAVAREKGLGRSDAAALAAGENELRRAAGEEHLGRVVGGGIFLGLSVIALGLGTTFAAADLTSNSFDRDDQDGVAAALLVGGALGTVGAIDFVFSPMPNEAAWEGYSAGRKVGAAPAPRVTAFGVAPLPEGGARVGLGGAF